MFPSTNKTVAIVQARLGSSRLPRKVMMDVCGETMLGRVIERLNLCRSVDQIVVATTTSMHDEELVDYCGERNWFYSVGSEEDVLDRYWQTANEFRASHIVRITSDCPLLDPELVDMVVDKLHGNVEFDYTCNFHPNRNFPRGLDVEAFTYDTLRRVHHGAIDQRFREHVTLKIYNEPEQFNIGSIECPFDLSSLRWTVDTEDDLALIRSIYSTMMEPKLASENDRKCFGWREILKAYPANPKWLRLNQNTIQKAA